MITNDLKGKRILVTQANTFMGPKLCEVFAEMGAEVITDNQLLTDPALPGEIIAAAGTIDVLVINLAVPAPFTKLDRVESQEWQSVFAALVDPLPRLVTAVLPQMMARQSGKILLMGSASALRGMKRASTYSAARGAQLAYVQAAGVEMAPQGIQINAIAQNFVDNPTYFSAETKANPAFQERLAREVPLGRLVSMDEDAQFAAYLCSDAADCFVGQVFPVSGGWAS
ncbi:SDR family oxidoreductase [Porticoccaceae bacterium]|jgi:2-keto-3-deoxy-L-fuconate dehydrogenase|nr:SDR family oxidoreductase [Porticoccaceae bacterium]MDA8902382.1 SDR family oxidoreductase [Porticoccaceae bacterium]MDA8920445.1 SDR family oxidoreductase [Porticoccaceae bacterium]MDA8935706.1 SDR family oxidoreductase [Porticoccaceae bacterium]MDA9560209.1 SDR family oxidoreductase [Porticoccaceae bacterium]